MGLSIRLSPRGRSSTIFYRIMVANKLAPHKGKYIEQLGTYNPRTNRHGYRELRIKPERVKYWLSVGAQPTNPMIHVLSVANIVPPKPPPVRMSNRQREKMRRDKLRAEAEALGLDIPPDALPRKCEHIPSTWAYWAEDSPGVRASVRLAPAANARIANHKPPTEFQFSRQLELGTLKLKIQRRKEAEALRLIIPAEVTSRMKRPKTTSPAAESPVTDQPDEAVESSSTSTLSTLRSWLKGSNDHKKT